MAARNPNCFSMSRQVKRATKNRAMQDRLDKAEAMLWKPNLESFRLKTDLLTFLTESMAVFLVSGNAKEASAMLLRRALRQTQSECGFIGLVDGTTLLMLAFEGM